MRKNFLFLHLRKRAYFPARQSRLELLPAILVPPKPICVYLMSARIKGITLRSLKRWAQGWLNGVVRWSRKKIHETFDRLLAEPCARQKDENGYCLPASKTHSSLILFSGRSSKCVNNTNRTMTAIASDIVSRGCVVPRLVRVPRNLY